MLRTVWECGEGQIQRERDGERDRQTDRQTRVTNTDFASARNVITDKSTEYFKVTNRAAVRTAVNLSRAIWKKIDQTE